MSIHEIHDKNGELNLERVTRVAFSIALEAGHLTLSNYRNSQQVRHKMTDVDLVTATDLASEELITRRLSQHFPHHGILAEEGNNEESRGIQDAIWIVDPLDGTTNFAHGHPFYAVSMALQLDGKLVVGVVHAPVLGLTWTAWRGGGFQRNRESSRVSQTETLSTSLCSSGFPYDRRTAEDNNVSEWSKVVRVGQGVRRCGAAAIDLALIADGTYDAYWEKRLSPWDMAAGAILVEEAGGRVTSIDGHAVPPWPEVLVATNGLVHDELISVLT